MKKISYEEFKKAHDESYGECREKDCKYFFNKAWHYMTDDGYIISFERPRIESCMYYDDETEAPSTRFESFKHYNMFYNFNNSVDRWMEKEHDLRTKGCTYGNHARMHLLVTNGSFTSIATVNNYYNEINPFKVRNLTDEEIQEIIEINNAMKTDYEKRLKTYYKKYSHKITTYGYWANR